VLSCHLSAWSHYWRALLAPFTKQLFTSNVISHTRMKDKISNIHHPTKLWNNPEGDILSGKYHNKVIALMFLQLHKMIGRSAHHVEWTCQTQRWLTLAHHVEWTCQTQRWLTLVKVPIQFSKSKKQFEENDAMQKGSVLQYVWRGIILPVISPWLEYFFFFLPSLV